MGYESRIYVVEKTSLEGSCYGKEFENLYYGSTIAKFNLSRIDDEILGMIFKNGTETGLYIFEGEDAIHTDCYGKPMTEIPLEKAVEIFIHAKNCFDYRRYAPVAGMLMGFDPKQWGKDDLVVLHFGY